MQLIDLIERDPTPEPWAEDEKIPWNDPDFSRRMLAEHLSQAHDSASRRGERIAEHVSWIHRTVLHGALARILDLGCGPGLYASELARLGHACTGIDFSPASIEYARRTAEVRRGSDLYLLGDIREAEYGEGFDLVMLVFGEFNVFRPEEARAIVDKARRALTPNGTLLLEAHRFEAVQRMGETPSSWRSRPSGLFSARPHLVLEESFWHEERQVAIQRYFVIDAGSADVSRYGQSVQAYSDAEYRALIEGCGFRLQFSPHSLAGGEAEADFVVLLGRLGCGEA